MGTPRHGHSWASGPERPAGTTNTYSSWKCMKQRCLNPNAAGYQHYGGRGIHICDKWMRFEGFLDDMGEAPDGHSLDRIDNDGPYNKENCRWATQEQQCNNTRVTRKVVAFGVTKTVAEWAKSIGISRDTMYARLFVRKMDPEVAVSMPLRNRSIAKEPK
jgi:hypothetical protein